MMGSHESSIVLMGMTGTLPHEMQQFQRAYGPFPGTELYLLQEASIQQGSQIHSPTVRMEKTGNQEAEPFQLHVIQLHGMELHGRPVAEGELPRVLMDLFGSITE